jgi:hypothetical protein
MKMFLKFLALASLLASLGCKTTIAPGADPVIVTSQQSLEISLAVVDKFLKFEKANQTSVSPETHRVAETLRKEFPAPFRIARELLAKYKASKDEETKRLLNFYVLETKRYATQAQAVQ